jgi:ABC-2 type transport system ATP-binding protein
MRNLIGRIAQQGRTVLVSSHILSELEQFSDWLFVIEQGRLMYAGQSEKFAADAGHEIVLAAIDPAQLLALADVVSASGLEAGRDKDFLVVRADGHEPRQLAAKLNAAAASNGIVLAELHVRRPNLESSYLRMVERGIA